VPGCDVQPPPEGHATWNDWYLSVGVPADELDLTGDGSDRLFDPRGEGPTIWHRTVPEPKQARTASTSTSTPPAVTARCRPSSDGASSKPKVDELVAAGASVVRRYPDDFETPNVESYFVVMGDPEGNEFCVA